MANEEKEEDKGRALQLGVVEGISERPAALLQEWLQEKWDDNCRYGRLSIEVFTELVELSYQLGKKDAQ